MSFINPLYLFALIGISAPILIHLTRNFRAKKVQFSSIMFLRATPKELIRKRRLRDLLLMILRTLLFALLVFAFARPYLQKENVQIFASEHRQSVVVLLDRSYSMSYGHLFEQARQKVRELIGQLQSEDEVSLVAFSEQAQQITPFTAERSLLLNLLSTLKTDFHSTNFYPAVQLAEEILKEGKNPDKRILMISDFQEEGFSSPSQWKLSQGIRFIPLKIAADEPVNSFIAQFSLRKSRTGPNVQAEFKTEIETIENNKDKRIELWLNGQKVDVQTAHLDQINQAFFQQFNLKEGRYQGFVKLENDRLEADNSHYFTFAVEGLPKLLCIARDQGRRSSAFFLKSAFDLGDASHFDFRLERPGFLSSKKLIGFPLLFVDNLAVLNDSQFSSLRKYLADGGHLVISFSDKSDLNRVAGILHELNVGKLFIDAEQENVDTEGGFIARIDFKHPIFSDFVESGAEELYRPKFRKMIRIEPDSQSTVLASYNSGLPFLIETNFGKGKIITCTSTLNTDWNDFPVYEIFVPFLYQLSHYLVEKQDEQTSFLVGETVILPEPANGVWQVKNPVQKIEQVKTDSDGITRYTNIEIPGNYSVQAGQEQFAFSVNVDVRESDLRSRDEQEVKAVFTRTGESVHAENATTSPLTPQETEKKQKIWIYLFILILGIFMMESLFAHWSGFKAKMSRNT